MSSPTEYPTAFSSGLMSGSLTSMIDDDDNVLDNIPLSEAPTSMPTYAPTTPTPTFGFTDTEEPIPMPTFGPTIPVPAPVAAPVEVQVPPPPVLEEVQVQVSEPPTDPTSLEGIGVDDEETFDQDAGMFNDVGFNDGFDSVGPADNDNDNLPVSAPTINEKDEGSTVQGTGSKWDLVGFQSDWGSAHTGSMVYDFHMNSIYLTGTTFTAKSVSDTKNKWDRSTCFVGEIPMADIKDWKTVDDPKPVDAVNNPSYTLPDSMKERELMSCQVIYFDGSPEADKFLYVGGVDEPDAQIRNGNIGAFLNTYERDEVKPDWTLKLAPTGVVATGMEDAQVTVPIRYPVAMINGRQDGREVVMMLMVSSDDGLLTEEYIESGDANNAKNHKNSLLPPGLHPMREFAKRGSNYYVSYQMFAYDSLSMRFEFLSGEDLGAGTSETYPTGVVNLSPMGFQPVIVGHIKGGNPDKFATMPRPINQNNDLRYEDADGFVQYANLAATGNPTYGTGLRYSSIEMDPPLDDFIHDICLGKESGDGQYKEFYVVGSTYGTMEAGFGQQRINTNILDAGYQIETDGNHISKLSAFVSKVIDGEKAWTTQLYAVTPKNKLDGAKTEAFGCHMIENDPTLLYVGGTVYNGGTMDTHHKSAGGDDLWVIQMSTEDGSLRWIKQVGSAGDDRISPNKGIQAAYNGDAIVYGSTTGELYRKKEKGETSVSDIFVTTFGKEEGNTLSTVSLAKSSAKKDGIIGAGTALVAISLLMCGCIFYKFRRPTRRGQSRPKGREGEGVFTEDNSNNIAPSYLDDTELNVSTFHDNEAPVEINSVINTPPNGVFHDDPVRTAEKTFNKTNKHQHQHQHRIRVFTRIQILQLQPRAKAMARGKEVAAPAAAPPPRVAKCSKMERQNGAAKWNSEIEQQNGTANWSGKTNGAAKWNSKMEQQNGTAKCSKFLEQNAAVKCSMKQNGAKWNRSSEMERQNKWSSKMEQQNGTVKCNECSEMEQNEAKWSKMEQQNGTMQPDATRCNQMQPNAVEWSSKIEQ
eukprot:jgi/Psemu1/34516/gm1.34516_g